MTRAGMGRIALITGAAGGIGLATVEAFRTDGWEVIGVDRRAPISFPPSAAFWLVDLAAPETIERLVDRLTEERPTLDALVNNAPIQVAKPMLETSLDEWDRVQAVNLRAIFQLCRLVHPLLKAAGGAIVNVGSVHALATSSNLAAYAATKGGLLALTRAMALEFGADGIRVNSVLPGATDTLMLEAGLQRRKMNAEETLGELPARTALGRIRRPNAIAQGILFLADGKRSSYITGQALVVDGGASARLSTE